MLLFIARLTSLLTSVTCMSVWISCIPCLGLLIIFFFTDNVNFPLSSSPARACFRARNVYNAWRINGFLCDVTISLESNASMDLLSVNQVEERKIHMAAVGNLARHHRALVLLQIRFFSCQLHRLVFWWILIVNITQNSFSFGFQRFGFGSFLRYKHFCFVYRSNIYPDNFFFRFALVPEHIKCFCKFFLLWNNIEAVCLIARCRRLSF